MAYRQKARRARQMRIESTLALAAPTPNVKPKLAKITPIRTEPPPPQPRPKKLPERPQPHHHTDKIEESIILLVGKSSQTAGDKDKECVVCMEHAADIILKPCHHACLCVECAQRLLKERPCICPICRSKVTKARQFF